MIRKLNTIIRVNLILAVFALVALTALPAFAQFFGGQDVPDWTGNAHYTNQTWTFSEDIDWKKTAGVPGPQDYHFSPPVAADAGYVNEQDVPNMYYTFWGDAFAWAWVDKGPMGADWSPLQGMVGGMGKGSFDFKIPIAVGSAGVTNVWVQYVSFIPNTMDGGAVNAQIAADANISNVIGNQIDKNYVRIEELDDKGGTGDWWLITELWEVEEAIEFLYVRVNANANAPGQPANLIDSVQVVTRFIPDVINNPPVLSPIGNHSVKEKDTLSFTVKAEDPDENDTVTYSYSANPEMPGAMFNRTSGEFSWTAPAGSSGNYTMVVLATDNGGKTDQEEFTVTVVPANHAPELAPIGNKSVEEGQTLSFTVTATDADENDTVTYSYSATPEMQGAILDKTSGEFSWTVPEGAAGTYTLTVTATDDGDPVETDQEELTVTVGAVVNHAPELAPIGNKSVEEGQTLSFTVTATDADENDTVTYSYSATPEMQGAILDKTSGKFSWTVPEGAAGTYTLTVTATDDDGKTDQEELTVTVGTVNHAPELAPIGNKSVEEGQTLSFTVTATDADENDTVTYSYSATPEMQGAILDKTSGEFSWTVPEGAAGTYTLTVTATDDGDPVETDQEELTVTVGAVVNHAPELAPIGNKSVEEGQTLSFTVTATDADENDTVTYSYSAAPEMQGAILDKTSGEFSWTVPEGAAGTYTLTVTATDDGEPVETDQEELTVTVGAIVNHAPKFDAIGNKMVKDGDTLTFNVHAEDSDGDAITYSMVATPEMPGATLDEASGVFSWTPAKGTTGSFDVVITATDSGTPPETAEATFTVKIISMVEIDSAVPNWDGEEGFTLQKWAFTLATSWQEIDVDQDGDNDAYILDGDGYLADEALVNDYGGAFFIRTDYGDSFAWEWVDEGPMGQEWDGVQGMLGGMGVGTFDFKIKAADIPEGYVREIWIQYLAFIPNGLDGSAMHSQLATDDDFTALVGEQIALGSERVASLVDQGSLGDWWLVTELWQVAEPIASDLFIRTATSANDAANMIDSFYVITRAIDPGNQGVPEVSGTNPADNETDVPASVNIEITFNKRMDTQSAEAAFSITPEVSGSFAWTSIDSVLTFTPDAPLTPLTAYQVSMAADAMDDAGNSMAAPLSFTFTTRDYVPPVADVDGGVSGTVDQDNLSIIVGGTEVYGYRYRLDNGEWQEASDTSVPLNLTGLADGAHTLEIQVRDSLNGWVDTQPLSWTVMAPPRIVSVSPEGKMPTPDAIMVDFSEAMDTQSVTAALQISPAVPGTISWEAGDTRLVYTPDPRLNSGSNYTVTIGTDARDLAGNTLAESYSWSFTTLQVNMLTCPVSEDTYVLFGGMGGGVGYPQKSSKGEPKLKAGAISIVDARTLIRFDLSPLTDAGLTAEDVVTAKLVYNMVENAEGMDVGPVAPKGTPMYGFVHVLDTYSVEKTGETTAEPFIWTEAVSGEGYVNMNNKPGYVADGPLVTVEHSTGHDTVGSFDIALLVRGWLDGRWANNGLELRDQDDESLMNNEIPDGYSWHMASREDTARAPYLEVVYDTQRLRIKDRAASAQNMSAGQSRALSAGGGNPNAYQWQVSGPDGSDITASTLSAASGANVTFTAPDLAGVVTITLKSGELSDHILIGIGSVGADGQVSWIGSSRAPLYLVGGTGESESLTKICDNVLAQMGPFNTVNRVSLNTGNGQTLIGGTCQDGGAEMVVTPIDNPSGLSAPVFVSLETSDGQFVEMEISTTCAPVALTRMYAVLVDTGSPSAEHASDIFMLGLYDQNGDPLACDTVCGLKVTIPFNPVTTGSNPLNTGEWAVGHAADLNTFFAGHRDNGLGLIPVEDVVSVDEANHTITFDTTHCSVFGLVHGTGDTFIAKPDESLGGGCFIQRLVSDRSSNTGLFSKIYHAITAMVQKIKGGN